MGEKARAHVMIRGRVQGVFFRVETRRAAQGYGVAGWVRNRSDGTVEAVFEGDRTQVEAMIQWCRQGPPHARVTDISVDWQDYSAEFSGFDITY